MMIENVCVSFNQVPPRERCPLQRQGPNPVSDNSQREVRDVQGRRSPERRHVPRAFDDVGQQEHNQTSRNRQRAIVLFGKLYAAKHDAIWLERAAPWEKAVA